MLKIFEGKDFSKLLPYIKYYLGIIIICSIVIIVGPIVITGFTDFSFNEKLLIVLNVILITIVIATGIAHKNYNNLMVKNILMMDKIKEYEESITLYNISNKVEFIKKAEALILSGYKEKYAVVHYDINKFTVMINSVGYKIGDEIIFQIGTMLNRTLKDYLVGKTEGDNYFVLFNYSNQDALIEQVVDISNKIENLCVWTKTNFIPVVKAGIVFIDQNDIDVRTAIDKAIFVKRLLKDSYKSKYAIYNEKIANNLIEVKRIEDDMNRALGRKEFKIYLQPKINLMTGKMVGAEALVRWEHHKLGLIGPDKFIPIFEKNGFITKLDKFVFEEVCSNIRCWFKSGYDVVPISVNVSRMHFLNNNFVSDFNEIKKKYDIPDKFVEIEITESTVFSRGSEDEVFEIMNKFKNFGFRISMDDFGSGYSSLGLLKDMPIDTLKLDKLFLNNIEDYSSQMIVSNIVNMAKNLNLNVVCEGVETCMQIDFLRDIGCDIAQGYIYSKPEPISYYNNFTEKWGTVIFD